MALIFCPECGKEISDTADRCINCGFAISNKFGSNRDNVKKKKKLPILIVIIAILLVGSFFGVKQYKSYTYQQNLNTVCYEIILSGAKAEECGNLVHDVWYNTIFEESDESTDKYTKSNGSFNDDFNDSIEALYSDDDFADKIQEIKSEQETVLNLMKKLKNPTSDYANAYEYLNELYEEYINFTNMAINPKGNLQSFTDDFNMLDESFTGKYKKMKMFIE